MCTRRLYFVNGQPGKSVCLTHSNVNRAHTPHAAFSSPSTSHRQPLIYTSSPGRSVSKDAVCRLHLICKLDRPLHLVSHITHCSHTHCQQHGLDQSHERLALRLPQGY